MATRPRFYHTLYFRVIAGIVAGVALGSFYPSTGEAMKPLGDGFIKLIRMMIAPVIFLTVVTGIARIGDMRKLGRVGLKALIYFEVVTTVALLVGFVVVKVVQPGAGINASAATLDAKAVQQYTTSGKQLHAVDFVLHIIPDTLVGAFANGEILQVLLIAILFGVALAAYHLRQPIVEAADSLTHLTFEVIALIMKAAPFGAFGAMAFTIGKYGLKTLLPLGKLLLCVYLTSALFVFLVLGLIARLHGFSLWKFLKYIKEELLLVLGTSSSEVALPRIIVKLERLGCSKSVVGLVVPSGYSFNLDGTAIYLTIAALFVAQATNTHLSGQRGVHAAAGADADVERSGRGHRGRLHHARRHAVLARHRAGGRHHVAARRGPLHVGDARPHQPGGQRRRHHRGGDLGGRVRPEAGESRAQRRSGCRGRGAAVDMGEYQRIRAAVIRGGTSRGVFFLASDLPADPAVRDRVILAIFGSPDQRQINGLGSGDPLTSKVAIIARSTRADADVDYTVGHVGIEKAVVDYEANCGNISQGVGPFAVDEGLVRVMEPVTVVRIFNTNTKKIIEAEVPVREGKALVEGISQPGSARPRRQNRDEFRKLGRIQDR